MAFNSLAFIFFLPCIVLLYYLIPSRSRWIALLLASYYFYMCWRIEYAALIVFSTCVDYFCSIWIEKSSSNLQRKVLLGLSLLSNLSLLFFFKYFYFFRDSVGHFVIDNPLPLLNVLLPLGISFYTFQSMGYTIDVYLGRQKAERHFGYLALFVSFFPQLVAGPIERAKNMLGQFKEKHVFDGNNITSGLQLILLGFFKKIVIADSLALYVDHVYASPSDFNSGVLICATIFFAFQIYCDFSGYTDIAIGSARLMGIHLTKNFRSPYFSKSIIEFWSRWHISLSTWFRDYLYIPLGGNRVGMSRWLINIMIVFVLSGLWHGAAFHFLVWGFLHGVYYLFSAMLIKSKCKLLPWIPERVKDICSMIVTFVIVCLLWVVFRAANVEDAVFILKKIVFFDGVDGVMLFGGPKFLQNCLAVCIVLFLDVEGVLNRLRDSLVKLSIIVRWGFYYIVLLSMLFFGVFFTDKTFIYFQF